MTGGPNQAEKVEGDAGKKTAAATPSARVAPLRSSRGFAGTVDSIFQSLGSNSSGGTEGWGHLEEMRQNTSDFGSHTQQTCPDSLLWSSWRHADCKVHTDAPSPKGT